MRSSARGASQRGGCGTGLNVRVMFCVYGLLIAAGLLYFTLVGLGNA